MTGRSTPLSNSIWADSTDADLTAYNQGVRSRVCSQCDVPLVADRAAGQWQCPNGHMVMVLDDPDTVNSAHLLGLDLRMWEPYRLLGFQGVDFPHPDLHRRERIYRGFLALVLVNVAVALLTFVTPVSTWVQVGCVALYFPFLYLLVRNIAARRVYFESGGQMGVGTLPVEAYWAPTYADAQVLVGVPGTRFAMPLSKYEGDKDMPHVYQLPPLTEILRDRAGGVKHVRFNTADHPDTNPPTPN